MSKPRTSPRKKKSSVPPSSQAITAFFKPYNVPKNRVPINDIVEDVITLVKPGAVSVNDESDMRPDDATIVVGPSSSSASSLTSLATSPVRVAPTKLNTAVDESGTQSDESTTMAEPQIPSESTLISLGTSPMRSISTEARGIGLNTVVIDPDRDELALSKSDTPSAGYSKPLEIRSPKAVSVGPPPSLPKPQPVANNAFNTSFSSISTLTTLSSQGSSRRIMRNGELAINNSDSDDPDESSDELADVLDFVPRKRVRLTPPVAEVKADMLSTPQQQTAARKSRRKSGQTVRDRAISSRVPSPPRTVYKHSLKNMIKQTKKSDESKVKIAEAEAAVRVAESRRAELAGLDMGEDDGLRLAAAATDDSDDGRRVMHAMARIEAMAHDERFHFFMKDVSCLVDFAFPTSSPCSDTCVKMLSDRHLREQACITGFVRDLASKRYLSTEMIDWFATRLAFEPREDLCEAYVGILRTASESTNLLSKLTSLTAFYPTTFSSTKGAARSSPNARTIIAAGRHNDSGAGQASDLPQGLGSVIRGLEYLAPIAGVSGIGKAVAELALTNIDIRVKIDSALRNIVQETIVALLDRADDAYESVRDQLCNIPKLSFAMQCQIVTAFPASTPRTHALRRRLALFCITQSMEERSPSSADWYPLIMDHLQHAPEFAIEPKTDYMLLKSLTQVLDIAIDAGFSDRRAWIEVPIVTSKPNTKGLFSTSVREGGATGSPETKFNDEVDALATQLATMQNHIKDGGMSHLRRTEAKSALHALEMRLKSSIRTKPKPMKGVFGTKAGAGLYAARSTAIDAFLARNNAQEGDEPKLATSESSIIATDRSEPRSVRKGVRFAVEDDWSDGQNPHKPQSPMGKSGMNGTLDEDGKADESAHCIAQ